MPLCFYHLQSFGVSFTYLQYSFIIITPRNSKKFKWTIGKGCYDCLECRFRQIQNGEGKNKQKQKQPRFFNAPGISGLFTVYWKNTFKQLLKKCNTFWWVKSLSSPSCHSFRRWFQFGRWIISCSIFFFIKINRDWAFMTFASINYQDTLSNQPNSFNQCLNLNAKIMDFGFHFYFYLVFKQRFRQRRWKHA